MKLIRPVIATTHVDRHGDRFTREALEGVAEQARSAYVPMIFNHDPRVPPLGRTVGAEVVRMEDGEYALVVVSEVFEPGDAPPLEDSGRKLRLRSYGTERPTLAYDRSYWSEADAVDLRELGAIVDLSSEEKKAFEPLSALTLALAGSATALAAGFLGKMGSDAWDLVKAKLRALLGRRQVELSEFLFVFELQLERQAGPLNVQCVLTSPSAEDLSAFLERGTSRLFEAASFLEHIDPAIRKVTIHYRDGAFASGFAVRIDGLPLRFDPLPPSLGESKGD